MLAAALEAEADGYVAELVDELDEGGHRLVTRQRPCPASHDHHGVRADPGSKRRG